MDLQHLAKINEGASILLTWIINLVKWNAGAVRYKFRHRTDPTAAAKKESLMHGPHTDDLDVGEHGSLSQGSDGAADYNHLPQESTADVQHSDDEDNRMNYKFAASSSQ